MKQQFSTQEECLLYFEKLRWRKKVVCPYCFSEKTHKAKSEQGRHVCYNCVKSFSVLVGTIFEDTRLSLPVWISIIKDMLKSKRIIPASILSAKFGVTVKTAWLTAMKIRCAMIDNETSLHGLISMDNKYIKLKHSSKKLGKYFPSSDEKKVNIQRLNVSHPSKDAGSVTPVNLTGLLKHYINQDKSKPSITVRSYETMDKLIEQISQKHTEQYKGGKKQRLQEDSLAFIRNGICNENKALSAKYLPFYLLEFEYKFKRKGIRNLFPQFMKDVFSDTPKSINISNTSIKKQVAYA